MKKILIVDDDYPQRTVLGRYLQRENIDVSIAACGVEGIQKAAEIIPNLILADYTLGDMNGFEFARKIKENEQLKSVPILLITASLADNLNEQAVKAGLSSVIIKPIDASKLNNIINQVNNS